MEDVAREANVSMTTVSHVLNGTRKVNAETAAAVKEAMRRVGYVPNNIARMLAGAESRTIGVAIAALTNHYFSETVRAIEAECARHGLMMFVSDTHDDPDQELKVVQSFHQRQVDGIVLAPTPDPQLRTVEYLRINEIPTVLVDRLLPCDMDQVAVDNKRPMAELVGHLIQQHGHRRIGFISGAPGLSTTEERLAGYRAALKKAALPFDEDLILCGQSGLEPARLAARQLLSLSAPPTAIVAANNLMTIGAMHALRDAHIDVPKKMALVGFDDFDWADYFSPRLTVVAQPLEELGARSLRLLMDRIKTPDQKSHVVRLAPELRIRNSCGCR
jgi:LacI family transcriptional regulator